ncbi:putative Trypsin-like cysteine/serine peptidase domain-containing protein [Seiridium cardinale]|uniref:Trypsin-like cysteine/serine peptidase domain-containing protein n=1 Tax=Seiridium cardinale TaxID=138064 RepID=A0ABR2XU55_9PEZI
MWSPRRTRSRAKDINKFGNGTISPAALEPQTATQPHQNVESLPADLNASTTKLGKLDQALLKKKQAWLSTYDVTIPRRFERHRRSVDATLVFAQNEAGTAVCISPHGLLLTCSHCVADTEAELDGSRMPWLLFHSGNAVAARCVAWDGKRDLALLQIVAAQPDPLGLAFPDVLIESTTPGVGSQVVCVGHPGSEDLEAVQPGIRTNYDVLHVSTGVYHGCAEGQDVQDNSEIGALMHDAWTYWGHSGAPIFCMKSGHIIGLHSSWDDETGMRRGIALEALQQFLKSNSAVVGADLLSAPSGF